MLVISYFVSGPESESESEPESESIRSPESESESESEQPHHDSAPLSFPLLAGPHHAIFRPVIAVIYFKCAPPGGSQSTAAGL